LAIRSRYILNPPFLLSFYLVPTGDIYDQLPNYNVHHILIIFC